MSLYVTDVSAQTPRAAAHAAATATANATWLRMFRGLPRRFAKYGRSNKNPVCCAARRGALYSDETKTTRSFFCVARPPLAHAGPHEEWHQPQREPCLALPPDLARVRQVGADDHQGHEAQPARGARGFGMPRDRL